MNMILYAILYTCRSIHLSFVNVKLKQENQSTKVLRAAHRTPKWVEHFEDEISLNFKKESNI